MKAIKIQRLRSLLDTGFLNLSPITLLVGGNSSGKSTFLRTLPLLRQSGEARKVGPLLWNGRLVDFGGYDDAVTRERERDGVGFHFRLNFPKADSRAQRGFLYRGPRLLSDTAISASSFVRVDGKRDNTYVSNVSLKIFGHGIHLSLDPSGLVTSFYVNGRDVAPKNEKILADARSGLFPELLFGPNQLDLDLDLAPAGFRRRHAARGMFNRLISKTIRDHVWHNVSDDEIIDMTADLAIGRYPSMLEQMITLRRNQKVWTRTAEDWSTNSTDFLELSNLVIARFACDALEILDAYIGEYAKKCFYIAPIRASAERYYRRQDLAVDEVDFRGQNLAMFIRNLSDTQRRDLETWMERHFGFAPRAKTSHGHVSLVIRDSYSQFETNLSDAGFGFSQILPILTQIWVTTNTRFRDLSLFDTPLTFCIEQPELHLHPKIQAQIADIFIWAVQAAKRSKIDLRFLIETHSETILNRIGSRIADETFDKNDVNVLIFDRNSAGSTIINKSSYSDEGILIDWPTGFFAT